MNDQIYHTICTADVQREAEHKLETETKTEMKIETKGFAILEVKDNAAETKKKILRQD